MSRYLLGISGFRGLGLRVSGLRVRLIASPRVRVRVASFQSFRASYKGVNN